MSLFICFGFRICITFVVLVDVISTKSACKFWKDNETFSEVFTSKNASEGLAICEYNLKSVKRVLEETCEAHFNGESTTPITQNITHQSHPDLYMDNTSKEMDNFNVAFSNNHPLMYNAINDEKEFLSYRTKGNIFPKLVVDEQHHPSGGSKYITIFAGTVKGNIYCIGELDSIATRYILENNFVGTSPEPIRAMVFKNQSLYVSSNSVVRQINVGECNQIYNKLMQCSLDPRYRWSEDKNICEFYPKKLMHVDGSLIFGFRNKGVKFSVYYVSSSQTMCVFCNSPFILKDKISPNVIPWFRCDDFKKIEPKTYNVIFTTFRTTGNLNAKTSADVNFKDFESSIIRYCSENSCGKLAWKYIFITCVCLILRNYFNEYMI